MSFLTIEMRIPIESDVHGQRRGLIFRDWLPLGRERGISLRDDGLDITLWFDLKSAWEEGDEPSEDELRKYSNVEMHSIRADIATEISPELAQYMAHRDVSRRPSPSEQEVQGEYEALGERVLASVLRRVNRVIMHARARGQFWLHERAPSPDHRAGSLMLFRAHAQVDGGASFKFRPGFVDTIRIVVGPTSRDIGESDWDALSTFVRGASRVSLSLELLARAEQLASHGDSRGAITEAVAALEVELGRFARGAKPKLAHAFGARLGLKTLQSQIDRLGLTATINYLLPLLLPEEVLPAKVLSNCRDAIQQRQNVVHNGQRTVQAINDYLRSIKACCKALRNQSSSDTKENS